MGNAELIEEARKVADKGVPIDDGFIYSVPAADLKRYRDAIHDLVVALESAEALDGERLEMIEGLQARYVKDADILFLARKDAERDRDAALSAIAAVRARARYWELHSIVRLIDEAAPTAAGTRVA